MISLILNITLDNYIIFDPCSRGIFCFLIFYSAIDLILDCFEV